MSHNEIEEGDLVKIRLSHRNLLLYGRVLHVPKASPMDCWHIKQDNGGLLFYVQSFIVMELLAKRGEE